MARMTFKAGDEYALKLSRLGKATDEVAKKAIYKGAGVVTDAVRKNLRRVLSESKYSTGDLEESLGITPIDQDKDGNYNAKVGFDGYDQKGVPNQLKARVIESGSSKVQKRPFVRPALKESKKEAVRAMEKAVDEETKRIMK